MNAARITLVAALLLISLLAATTSYALDPTDVPKWSQLPGPPLPGTQPPMGPGEDIWSDVDWRAIMMVPPPTDIPNWTIADDFRSDGRPITAVRWWGSYPDPALEPKPVSTPDGGVVFVPMVEDGFLLSFFSDMPSPIPPTRPPTGASFSKPDVLLGSYVAPIEAVTITPLPFAGWDGHRVWQYEACLKDMHLDHASPLATDDSFDEKAGDIYWLSIVAENGHRLFKIPDPTNPDEMIWRSEDTNDPMLPFHYWGWHTSPDEFQDVATMSSLVMPGNQWIYLPDWQPIHPQHGLWDMSFELLTPIPEPSTLILGAVGIVGLVGLVFRRGRRA